MGLNRENFRRTSFILFVIALLAILMLGVPIPARAATLINGGTTITVGGSYQLDAGATGIVTVSTTDAVTITGDPGGHSDVRINCTLAGTNLTIEDLNVTLSAISYSAIAFTGTGNTLTLLGSSNLAAGYAVSTLTPAQPVVRVSAGVSLTITGTGQLTVATKSHGAGIGSGYNAANGSITILNTTVYAYAHGGGNAIGGGYVGANTGGIRIENSTVTVETIFSSGGPFSAGIGGGAIGSGGTIDIINSFVTATTDTYGSAIGVGVWGGNCRINITNGSTVIATSKRGAAAIGDCYGVDASVTGSSTILIEDSTVTATSTSTSLLSGAAIGGGAKYTYAGMYGGQGSYPSITIKNSDVTATAAGGSAAIGSGSNSGNSASVGGGNITITNSTVSAQSAYAAAIGGGYGYAGGTILIEGDDTDVTATGGDQSAGIGGSGTAVGGILQGGSLTIKNQPIIKAYSNVVDGAIQGVAVAGQANTTAKIVHGSLHSSLVDQDNAQDIIVESRTGTNPERYALVLPKGYVSFASNTSGIAASGQYVSRIVIGSEECLLANVDGASPAYIYSLSSADIHRYIDLQLVSEVRYDLNYLYDSFAASPPASQIISAGILIDKPINPLRDRYQFEGWYKEPACTTPWDFENDLTPAENFVLYAKWSPASPGAGKTIQVTFRWSGNAIHPAGIQVQLYRNGTAYGTPVTLNKENNWTHVWTGLDTDAVWSVDEPNVPDNYTKSITMIEENSFLISNSTVTNVPIAADVPKTNDTNNLLFYIIVLFLSAVLILRRKVPFLKRRRNET